MDAIVLATAGGEDGTEASPGQYASLVRIADAERIATVLMADGDAAEVVDGAFAGGRHPVQQYYR